MSQADVTFEQCTSTDPTKVSSRHDMYYVMSMGILYS